MERLIAKTLEGSASTVKEVARRVESMCATIDAKQQSIGKGIIICIPKADKDSMGTAQVCHIHRVILRWSKHLFMSLSDLTSAEVFVAKQPKCFVRSCSRECVFVQ